MKSKSSVSPAILITTILGFLFPFLTVSCAGQKVVNQTFPKVKGLILAIVLMSCPIWVSAQTYSTSFPLTENPISERGKWIGGQSADGNLWGNVQTRGGTAYGVSEPTTYGDPTAILTGSWAANQQAQVTVEIGTTPTACCHEIEVRLRVTISANRITGYEVYCSVVPGSKYCHIARWSGPIGLYCNIEPSSPSINLMNGDVLMGTVTGSNPALITAFLNGAQIMQVSDTGNEGGEGTDCGAGRPVFASGSPGIGFYDNRNDNQWNYFGISKFTANAEPSRAQQHPVQHRSSSRSPNRVVSERAEDTQEDRGCRIFGFVSASCWPLDRVFLFKNRARLPFTDAAPNPKPTSTSVGSHRDRHIHCAREIPRFPTILRPVICGTSHEEQHVRRSVRCACLRDSSACYFVGKKGNSIRISSSLGWRPYSVTSKASAC